MKERNAVQLNNDVTLMNKMMQSDKIRDSLRWLLKTKHSTYHRFDNTPNRCDADYRNVAIEFVGGTLHLSIDANYL